jgi:outer membrane protein assembly factor BamB
MRFVLPVVLIVLLGACSSPGPIYEPTKLEPLKSGLKVKQLWSASTSSSAKDEIYDRLEPVIKDGVLYSVGAKGRLLAVDIIKGKRLWKSKTELVISGGLGVNTNFLFVGSADAEVVAFSRENGEPLWRKSVSSEILSPPVATDSHVIVRCGDGSIYALDAKSGATLWQTQRSVPVLSLRGNATPVIAGDTVFIGMADGRLAALSLYDGGARWETAVVVPQGRTELERMSDVDAKPIVEDDTVYAVAHQGRVVALSTSTGTLKWSHDIGSAAGMALDEHHLYVVDDEDNVWALDRRNGAALWKQDKFKYRNLTAPLRSDDAVVVGDFEGYLHWLSLEDGHILARYQVDNDGLRVSPLEVDGVLYARSRDGKVKALQLKP